jgi:RNA polymerase sigma factor (sigma-70 family)
MAGCESKASDWQNEIPVSASAGEPGVDPGPGFESIDRAAVAAIVEGCLPALERWARGRVPAAARGRLDSSDLVQEAALRMVARLDRFELRHQDAVQAYLRKAVLNLIRDEARRISRRPALTELPDDLSCQRQSPFERVASLETYARYRKALAALRPRDRELMIARLERDWSIADIARSFGLRTADAARVAVGRAFQRLTKQLREEVA